MFDFTARFLRQAEEDGLDTTSGVTSLNGFTVMSLDNFVKHGSFTQFAADEDDKTKKDKKDGDDKKDDKKDDEFGLGSKYRTVPDEEMQEYLGRIKDKGELDKKDRYKGVNKDRYSMPYIHQKNIKIVDGGGREYDLGALRAAIIKRPSHLLKKNEKMKHSDGSSTQFYNVGLPALKGLAVNEKTGEFVVVDTCPGSGSCKTFCYAMKGSYVQFKEFSILLTRTLNFLLNKPEAFKARLKAEIASVVAFNSYNEDDTQSKTVVRWHDAGDFFSPQYTALAFDIARAFPDVEFYAYTKIGAVANANKPSNFMISFSDGGTSAETKKIDLTNIKRSVVVPADMFNDLVLKIPNGRPLKDEEGQAQFKDAKAWEEFKNRVITKYKVDRDTLLSYNEYMDMKNRGKLGDQPAYWNVIVPPGGGDNSSTDGLVHITFLLFH